MKVDGVNAMVGSIVAGAVLLVCIGFGLGWWESPVIAGAAGGIAAMLPVGDLRRAVHERDWHSLYIAPGAGTGVIIAAFFLITLALGRAIIAPNTFGHPGVPPLPSINLTHSHPASTTPPAHRHVPDPEAS